MKRFFIAVALTVACAPAFAQEVVGLQEAQTRYIPRWQAPNLVQCCILFSHTYFKLSATCANL